MVETEVYNKLPPLTISADPSTIICEGDSVLLTASGNYTSYIWSNGFEGMSIYVDSSETISVYAIDQFECTTDQSELLSIIVNKTPPTPTVYLDNQNYIFTEDTADYYHWFLNNKGIDQDQAGFDSYTSGSYYLQTEIGACLSDTSNIIVVKCIEEGVMQNTSISPNPNNGQFHLSLAGFENTSTTVSFYNYIGQQFASPIEIITNHCIRDVFQFDFPYLPSGAYFLTLEMNESIIKVPWIIIN